MLFHNYSWKEIATHKDFIAIMNYIQTCETLNFFPKTWLLCIVYFKKSISGKFINLKQNPKVDVQAGMRFVWVLFEVFVLRFVWAWVSFSSFWSYTGCPRKRVPKLNDYNFFNIHGRWMKQKLAGSWDFKVLLHLSIYLLNILLLATIEF